MSFKDLYWKLASDDPNERVQSAEELIRGLVDLNSEEEWNYAGRRLVKGLSSTRGSARLGFSMTLAELLQVRASNVSISSYLNLCDEFFHVTPSMKGNEQRGLYLGRLFALEILAKCQIWDLDSTTADDLCEFIKMTIELACVKIWLREAPFFALCKLLQRVCKQEKYVPGLKYVFKCLNDKEMTLTCEGIAVALSVSREQRVQFNSEYDWVHGDPMASANLNRMAKVLKELPITTGDVSDTKPYINFVWHFLLQQFHSNSASKQVESNEPPKKKKKGSKKGGNGNGNGSLDYDLVSLDKFWDVCVNIGFFSSSASPERKMWGMEIFLSWIQDKELVNVAALFSSNVVKAWCLHLSKPGRSLYTLSKRVADIVTTDFVERGQDVVISVLVQLMTYSANFDKLSKSKVVQQLLDSLDADGIAKLVHIILNNLSSTSTVLSELQWPLDNLLHLVRTYSADAKSEEWINAVFDALIPRAYYKPADPSSNDETAVISDDEEEVKPLTGSKRSIAQTGNTGNFSLLDTDSGSALGNTDETDGQKGNSEEDKELKIAVVLQDKVMSILAATLKPTKSVYLDAQRSWPYVVVQKIIEFGKSHPEFTLRTVYDEETNSTKTKAEKTLYKIHQRRNASRHVDSILLQAFELLFAVMMLQVYSAQPDAVSMLDDLQICYRKIKGKLAQQEESGDSDQSDTDPALVFTEILISLMSQHSMFLRKLCQDVWRMFSQDVSEQSLLVLCDVLNTQEGQEGQLSLFDVDGEQEGDEEEVEEEGEDNEDMEVEVDGDGEALSDSETDGDAVDSDYEMDDESKRKLADTLGVNNMVTFSDSEPDESSEEELMNDEQMSALDGHLSIIFRERKMLQTKKREERKNKKQARQNVVQLKNRVTDLLTIYFAEQPENLIGLVCLEPLLNLVSTTKDKQLEDKARELIRSSICRKTNYKLHTPEEAKKYLQLLKTILGHADDTKSKAFQLVAKQVAVFLSKLVINYDKEMVKTVIDVYTDSMKQWYFNPQSGLSTGYFTDIINYLGTTKSTKKE